MKLRERYDRYIDPFYDATDEDFNDEAEYTRRCDKLNSPLRVAFRKTFGRAKWFFTKTLRRPWNSDFICPRRLTVEYDVNDDAMHDAVSDALDALREQFPGIRYSDIPIGRWPKP